ncbi:AT-hook motif nuclear-localized protein 22-like [Iris pallida]|uniref:AT-hook motif nuclear-localized protein 22-like n=1 Tax=Iris pallida TaxID=29817 RepID=A0AAX6GRD8_IRIPA|nr:AT-hook motif nuclear-localized protein 22-like [Iris pallida]
MAASFGNVAYERLPLDEEEALQRQLESTPAMMGQYCDSTLLGSRRGVVIAAGSAGSRAEDSSSQNSSSRWEEPELEAARARDRSRARGRRSRARGRRSRARGGMSTRREDPSAWRPTSRREEASTWRRLGRRRWMTNFRRI